MLHDDESRKIFASKIKSLTVGNLAYLRHSEYVQYFHPETIPQKGDTIIDGGVSGNIDVEQSFLNFVGNSGHLYSFEPDPICYFQAYEQVKNINNMTLLPFGLSRKSGQVSFASKGHSSHVTDTQNEQTIKCYMTTVDTAVSQYNIKKVDMIKLDVEGSEENALLGAIKTIVKYRPKLIVSIYHKLEDIFTLPLFIDKLDLNYKLYMGHHRPTHFETVLYAVPE